MFDWMRDIAKQSGEKIIDSELYISIFTKDFMDNPQCCLELGIAMMLDKPITLLVKEGTIIPENIKKVAMAVEFFKGPDDIGPASERLMQKVFPGDSFGKISGSDL